MDKQTRYFLHTQESQFLEQVRVFRHIGYGRMMQIISHEWYRWLIERNSPTSGAQTPGECLGTLSNLEQKRWLAGYRADPLFREEGADHE